MIAELDEVCKDSIFFTAVYAMVQHSTSRIGITAYTMKLTFLCKNKCPTKFQWYYHLRFKARWIALLAPGAQSHPKSAPHPTSFATWNCRLTHSQRISNLINLIHEPCRARVVPFAVIWISRQWEVVQYLVDITIAVAADAAANCKWHVIAVEREKVHREWCALLYPAAHSFFVLDAPVSTI